MKNPPTKSCILRWRTVGASALAVCAAIALAACGNVSHVMLYQDSTLGVNGGVNPENNNVNLHIGYHRDFYMVAPKVAVDGTSTAYDAASTYGYTKLVINGLNVPDIDELVATGTAAVLMAKTPDAKAIFTGTAN